MKTINNNFRKTKIKKHISMLLILLLGLTQLWAQQIDQISLPGDVNGTSGIAGDIITADGKIFVYTSQNILVYDANNILITSISIDDGSYFGKFAPHYFWPDKYIADNQMMTYNPENQLLYVLAPNLDIKIIDTQSNNPTLVDTWDWVQNEHIQTPMHGFAILKYDKIKKRLFLIINARLTTQGEYSFHSRTVYLGIHSVNENGEINSVVYNETFPFDIDSNKTIFDVEFNDIVDPDHEQYNHFYLARRYIIETCILTDDDNNDIFDLDVISRYPDIVLTPGHRPEEACPHPGKFTKLIYVHKQNIHKIIAVPYRIPQQAYEPFDPCDIALYVLDLDVPGNSQLISSPHKRIIDVAFMEGNNDLIMCFGDELEFFNPVYDLPENHSYDIAYFPFDNSIGKFIDDISWINSNPPSKGPDDFVKLNIPLRIVKNADNPDNSFFLCKTNEIVRFDFSEGTYIPDESSRYVGEGNHFYRGTGMVFPEDESITYILDLAKSGFEIFTGNTHSTSVQTGFQALRMYPDPFNRKLYVYNDLNIHRSEVFYTNLDDLSSGASKLNHIIGQNTFGEVDNTAVGSIVYNPGLNHILIAKNSSDGGILAFDATGSSILTNQPDNLQNCGSYVKEMFISPNGKLYVITNSRNANPIIKIFDASEVGYPEITSGGLSIDVFEQNDFTTYNADFCYNPYNDQVYAVVSTNNTTLNPYFTTKNTDDVSNKTGALRPYWQSVLINADLEVNFTIADNIQMARQLICPEPDETPAGYKGELIINAGFTDDEAGSDAMEGLLRYDCETGNFYENTYPNKNFNQISFSKEQQKLFAFEGIQAVEDNVEHIANFFYLNFNPQTNFEEAVNFGQYNGQVLNIFPNKYNNKLYVQTKIDKKRLGEHPMKLLAYNMNNLDDPGYVPENTDLPNRGHYVELDRNSEALYWYYPVTNPYIDPYTNKIYLPNGGHSNVSVVEFVPVDQLHVHFSETDESNWLSIPRMANNESTNWEEFGNVEVVFDRYRFDDPYQTYFQLRYEKSAIGQNVPYTNTWTDLGWNHSPDPDTYSVRGYKMTMDDLSDNILNLYGNIKKPGTTFPVYEDTKNWIGYFLVQEQDVFDALEDHIEDIVEIWHQEYYCYKPNGGGIIFGPEGGGAVGPPSTPEWACSKSVHRLKYGEMLIINPTKTFDGNNDNYPMFYWSNGGFTPLNEPRPEPEYYSYIETDTYKPFIIELDSTANPQEIGAFVGNTCVGACSVIEADTAVILLAYINPGQEDSVTFEQHYSTKSIANVQTRSYMVLNEERGIFEKRAIKTTEGVERVFISFKRKAEEVIGNTDASFSIWPNPAGNIINFSFVAETEGYYSLKLYDVSGRLVSVIKESTYKRGIVAGTADLKGKGNKLIPGIYFIQINTDDYTQTMKLVIR